MKAIHENENITSSKTKKEQIQDQKSLMKSKTLHELLKQGGGQNLVIDFSMLSKRGKLNGLIEKAKKYQDISNQKIIEESDNDKKIENEGKKTNKSKISKHTFQCIMHQILSCSFRSAIKFCVSPATKGTMLVMYPRPIM